MFLHNDKSSTSQKDIILSMYVSNEIVSKYIKQKLLELLKKSNKYLLGWQGDGRSQLAHIIGQWAFKNQQRYRMFGKNSKHDPMDINGIQQ